MPNKPRLYAVEFLRIWFILLVVALHVFERYPGAVDKMYYFPNYGHAVELFAIIGGFFLYRRLYGTGNHTVKLIGKTYVRLLPGLLFVFLLSVLFAKVSFRHLPTQLALLPGTGMQPPSLTSGDWYIGAYFWTTCFLICLSRAPKWAFFLILGCMIYTLIVLRTTGPWLPPVRGQKYFMSTFYHFVGRDMARIIYGMGIGIFASRLEQELSAFFSPSRWSRLLGTAFEAWCIYSIFRYLMLPYKSGPSYVEVMVTTALFLVSIAHSWGYISSFLNSLKQIQYISRYVYSLLVGQIFIMMLMISRKNFGLDFPEGVLTIALGCIIVCLIEYHLIERRLIPLLLKSRAPAPAPK